MGQQANIVAFDGAASPVSHTFTGVGVTTRSGGLPGNVVSEISAKWREVTASTLPENAQARYTQTLTFFKNGTSKKVCSVEVPVMESISGQNAAGYTAAPAVAYTDRVEAVEWSSPRSAEATKRIATQLLINILGNVSTTVPAVVAGPAMDLLQRNIQVT